MRNADAPHVAREHWTVRFIAMGNASPDVQRTASRVTGSNAEEGFADAVARFVLGKG